jgi:hypothetical protein
MKFIIPTEAQMKSLLDYPGRLPQWLNTHYGKGESTPEGEVWDVEDLKVRDTGHDVILTMDRDRVFTYDSASRKIVDYLRSL